MQRRKPSTPRAQRRCACGRLVTAGRTQTRKDQVACLICETARLFRNLAYSERTRRYEVADAA